MKTTIVSLGELRDASDSELDLFVCSASFEERCKAVPRAIARCSRCIVAYNGDFVESLADNLNSLRQWFPKAVLCEMRTDDPFQTADGIVASLDDLWPDGSEVARTRVGIDVTTFTRESLLILIKYVWLKMREQDEVVVYYNRAREYAVGLSESEKWLSKGIAEVRSVLGYPGKLLPSRPNHLIVMTGFEDVRALRLVSEWEPSLLSLGVADPSEQHTAEHQRINEERSRRVGNIFGPVESFSFSAYDPLKASEAVLLQARRGESMNTIVAPMNTKISTIGAGLAAWHEPDIQLCYAQANTYNFGGYSAPGDTVYMVLFRKRDLHGSGDSFSNE